MGQVFGICYLLCYHKCKLIDVVDDIAFYPPVFPFYHLEEKNNKITGCYWYAEDEIAIPDSITTRFLSVDKGISICIMHYKRPSSKRLIIYNHGNAVDLGLCVNNMIILGDAFDADFIYYDYEGYGYSNGETHSHNLPRDLRAVYDYALQSYAGENIYFYGESIGSVPCCYLGATLSEEYEQAKAEGLNPPLPLAGIILHSAVHSGSKFTGGCLIECCDPLDNAEMIQKVKFPIFHIHGMQDEMIPFKLGKQLYEISKSEYQPWWVEDSSHLNIVANHEEEYVKRIKEFLEFCEKKCQDLHDQQEKEKNNTNQVVNQVEVEIPKAYPEKETPKQDLPENPPNSSVTQTTTPSVETNQLEQNSTS